MIRPEKNNLARLTKPRGRAILPVCLVLVLLVWVASFPWAISYGQEPGQEPQQPEKLVPEEFKNSIPYLSTLPSMIIAESLGVTEAAGISLDPRAKAERLRELELWFKGFPRFQGANIAANVGIGVHPTKHENEPTVAVNPQNEQLLVAGSHFLGPPAPTTNRCVAFTSSDGGFTWSEPFPMPHLHPSSACSDPVLAYAPDGNRVYYAYMDIKTPSLGGIDIVVSFSNDNGANWIGPTLVLDGSSMGPVSFIYDKPWIGTHIDVPGSQANNSFVYVTATLFGLIPGGLLPTTGSIAFIRSANQGVSWGNARLLDMGRDSPLPQVIVQGSRPVGGLGGEVLVAWYHSGADGWGPGNSPSGGGEFQIRTARSANNGLTFSELAVAASDSFEAPFFLGPMASFQRWWPTMMPDVEIDLSGVAHITYAHDPEEGSLSAEDGDVRYVSSFGPPYDTWSAPLTISDDGRAQAQGFPALETVGMDAHVIWEDHRLSPLPAANIFYDVFYTLISGGTSTPNARVTEASSLGDFNFNGDYFDLTAGFSGIFGVWTDRRDKISIFDDEDDVWGARIEWGVVNLSVENSKSTRVTLTNRSLTRK